MSEKMDRYTETPKSVAIDLGVDSSTVRAWCVTGKIPATKLVGRWRIRGDYEKYVVKED